MSALRVHFQPFPDPSSPLRVGDIPWDSDLFGFPCRELRCGPGTTAGAVRRFTHQCATQGGGLLVAKIPVHDVGLSRLLAECGFYPVETQLDIALPLGRPAPAAPARGATLRPATRDDLPALFDIASSAFSFDRFHLDSSLPRDKADLRYRAWAEKAVRDGNLLYVFANERTQAVLGFYHIRDLGDGEVDLSLAAVAPELQGAGIGALMYQAILAECRRLGFTCASTHISVANLPVANLFFRLGFTLRGAVYTFHHRPEPGP